MSKIDLDLPLRTVEAHLAVRVICRDIRDMKSIAIAVTRLNGSEFVSAVDANGAVCEGCDPYVEKLAQPRSKPSV